MSWAILLELLLKYSPEAIGLIQHAVLNISAGRSQSTVVIADWVELDRLSSLTSASVYARLGITPPPST